MNVDDVNVEVVNDAIKNIVGKCPECGKEYGVTYSGISTHCKPCGKETVLFAKTGKVLLKIP